MRNLVAFSIFAFNFIAFAGPEEHKDAQSCYVLENGQEGDLTSHVPQEICLETLEISPETSEILVYSYFQPELYKGLKLTSLTKKNDDWFLFRASNVLHDQTDSGCGEREVVQLDLSGQANSMGIADVSSLQISISIETDMDVCHGSINRTVLNYQLR